MAQQSNTLPVIASPHRIELPQDRTTKLFVLSMCSNFVMLKLFTKVIYELETANQEINSLSNLPRDVEKAKWRGIAALKRHYGNISDIPNESVLKRPPNWLVIMIVVFVGAGVIVYGQYQPQAFVGLDAWWNVNGGYLVVAFILFIAFALLIRFRRKRKGQ